MASFSTIALVAACVLTGMASATFAQSYGAPSGRDAATAPGGTEGIAGSRNEAEAIKGGDAVPVPPGTDGILVEEPQAPHRDNPTHATPPRP
ncbi:hypothetical protein [Methylobacterium marchantiae]|uniref:Uncharacterized protein n=1 Tax=Methylobacterium marchantiae TaxID=600331 RepID=A0ABW3WZ94_9HYPH|nr:hypothetical protein AIGOOFII_1831 [Methylobacterium marchantiae]